VVPLGTLTYFLFASRRCPRPASTDFVAALISTLVLFREFRSREKVWRAFVKAGRMAASIVVIVTAIGLIVGLIQVSGFAGRLSLLLAQLADGPLPLVL
jgi:TRAP-type uncharacterized transport system fused permease subunit